MLPNATINLSTINTNPSSNSNKILLNLSCTDQTVISNIKSNDPATGNVNIQKQLNNNTKTINIKMQTGSFFGGGPNPDPNFFCINSLPTDIKIKTITDLDIQNLVDRQTMPSNIIDSKPSTSYSNSYIWVLIIGAVVAAVFAYKNGYFNAQNKTDSITCNNAQQQVYVRRE